MMRRFWNWLMNIPGEDGSPWEIADEPHDIEYVTRIYGGGMEALTTGEENGY